MRRIRIPGLLLLGTEGRTSIPGASLYLSSIGRFNPTKPLMPNQNTAARLS
jgi:hypothetical protein